MRASIQFLCCPSIELPPSLWIVWVSRRHQPFEDLNRVAGGRHANLNRTICRSRGWTVFVQPLEIKSCHEIPQGGTQTRNKSEKKLTGCRPSFAQAVRKDVRAPRENNVRRASRSSCNFPAFGWSGGPHRERERPNDWNRLIALLD